jgi:chromosome segregation ATPase
VGEQVEPDSVELARLREELRSCRLELAERHRELETLHEERHDLLRRCEAAEERARQLATTMPPPTESIDPAPGRLRRRKARK